MQHPRPRERARLLVELAQEQLEAGDRAGARQSTAGASQSSRQIEDPHGQSAAFHRLAEQQARLGQDEHVERSLEAAERAIANMSDGLAKVHEICESARLYKSYLDDDGKAADCLQTATRKVNSLSDPRHQVSALCDIAFVCHALEMEDQTHDFASRALKAARSIDRSRSRAEALADAANLLIRIGRPGPAEGVWSQAEAAMEQIESPESRAYALLYLAARMDDVRQDDRSRRALAKAESTARGIGDRSIRLPLLEKLKLQRRSVTVDDVP